MEHDAAQVGKDEQQAVGDLMQVVSFRLGDEDYCRGDWNRQRDHSFWWNYCSAANACLYFRGD